jgi:hypothetical protein
MTSNVKKVSRTGAYIVQKAFEHIRVKQQGQNLQDEDQALALDVLNDLIKSWQREGLSLWKEEDVALFLPKGRNKFTVGQAELLLDNSTEYNTVYGTVGDWVRTTTTAASAAAATTIDITSFTSQHGVTINTSDLTLNPMSLLVENTSGDLDYYAISSISSLEITVSSISTAIDSGATVYIYYDHNDISGNANTDRKKPLKIYPEAIRLQQSTTYEIPINLIAMDDYARLPDKTSQGTPVQIAYQPKVDNTDIYVWPPTDNVENVLLFRCQMPFDIFNVSTDRHDLPSEWVRPLEWALAAELGQAFGIDLNRQMYLDQKAATLYQQALEHDQDNASWFMQPLLGW